MDDLPWGHSIITLEDRLQEIENLLSSKFYQAALALALTVPDICGKVEFPKEGVAFGKDTFKDCSFFIKPSISFLSLFLFLLTDELFSFVL